MKKTVADLELACLIADRTCHQIEDFWESYNIIPYDIVCEICDLIETVEEYMDMNYEVDNIEEAIENVQECVKYLVEGHEDMLKRYGAV